jgi:hypothetical protein
MPIDFYLNKVLSIIGLQDAAKDAITKGLSTCEDLEDMFMDMADDKTNIEATFRLVVDIKVVTDIDIRRVIFFIGFWPTLLTRILHGPTSINQCMSLTSDLELWLRQSMPPRMLQTHIYPWSVVLSIVLPMCLWMMPNGKPPQ